MEFYAEVALHPWNSTEFRVIPCEFAELRAISFTEFCKWNLSTGNKFIQETKILRNSAELYGIPRH
jgi:hypothetical protein